MKIPEDRNTRAEAMWRIISQKVDFRGKRVVDLGCGTGDFLWRTLIAGAKQVWGVDKDNKVQTYDSERRIHSDRFYDYSSDELFLILNFDINEQMTKGFVWNNFDIAMCFSVLPYLDNIPATLKWMSENFALCLIEAQYAPEPYNVGVLSDKGMAQLLVNNGFTDVEPLGTTTVEDRFDDDGNAIKRTIWMCK